MYEWSRAIVWRGAWHTDDNYLWTLEKSILALTMRSERELLSTKQLSIAGKQLGNDLKADT